MRKPKNEMQVIANTVIDRLGGTVKTSRLCKIRHPSVSGWRTAEDGIPRPWLLWFYAKWPWALDGLPVGELVSVDEPEPIPSAGKGCRRS
jgi:hypothetical protein